MTYVTADLHGKMEHLQALLKQVNFGSEDQLFILGDVIDRNGNGGVDILKWLLYQPNVWMILGNHEQMLLANRWVFEQVEEESVSQLTAERLESLQIWEMNGGGVTLKALQKESAETRQDILEYLEDCPLIDGVTVCNRNYLFVHSGLGNFSKEKKLRDYTPEELLWERPTPQTVYDPERFTVLLGHTPTVNYSKNNGNRIFKTESWWDLDTGAAFNGGCPMLLCLETLQEFYLPK